MPLRLLTILLMTTLMAALASGQDTDIPQEYQLKARYVLNMPVLSELPPQNNTASSYTICLIGDTPLKKVLAASQGKLVKNRPLAIRSVEDINRIDACQMLFIASSERYRLQPLLAEADRRGVLTISDMRGFVRQGGLIGLLIVDNRLTFDINQVAASKASISFSSQLLKLAHDIIR